MSAGTGTRSRERVSGRANKQVPNPIEPQQAIRVRVADGAIFWAHKPFLTYYSPVFDARLKSLTIEQQSELLELPEYSSSEFGLFLNWTYTQRIQGYSEKGNETVGSFTTGCRSDTDTLVRLWALAGSLKIPSLQAQTLDRLKSLDASPLDSAPYVFHHTPFSCPLYTYMVERLCWQICHGGVAPELISHIPRDALAAVLARFMFHPSSLA